LAMMQQLFEQNDVVHPHSIRECSVSRALPLCGCLFAFLGMRAQPPIDNDDRSKLHVEKSQRFMPTDAAAARLHAWDSYCEVDECCCWRWRCQYSVEELGSAHNHGQLDDANPCTTRRRAFVNFLVSKSNADVLQRARPLRCARTRPIAHVIFYAGGAQVS
jgi:hypothetical protein